MIIIIIIILLACKPLLSPKSPKSLLHPYLSKSAHSPPTGCRDCGEAGSVPHIIYDRAHNIILLGLLLRNLVFSGKGDDS